MIKSCIDSRNQTGYILITTLVLLGMLTLLGVSQISSNSTQTKVAANVTDNEISFEKTEGALNEAINKILNRSYSDANFSSNNNGLYLFNPSTFPLWKTVDWESNGSVTRSFNGASGAYANYIIEQLPSVVSPGQNMKAVTRIYRISGRAVGQNGTSSVLLQSTVQTQR